MSCWAADGSEPIIAGVFREMVDRMVALGGAIDPDQVKPGTKFSAYIEMGHGNVTPFHAEACKLAALELVEAAGVETWYHTS